MSQPTSSGGRDVVGQVGDDARRAAAEMRRESNVERVAGDDVEPAGIVRGDLAERRDRALVALDRDHARGAFGEQRARQPARARADLDDGDAVERAGGARDAAGQVEIEQEVLAERFARRRARGAG